MNSRKVARTALYLSPLLAFLVAAKLLNTDPPTNSAHTSPESDEALRTRFYQVAWNDAVGAAQKTLTSGRTYGRAWKTGPSSIAGAEPSAHLTEILRAQVPVLLFTDDLEVTLRDENDGRIRVDVRSASRIGRGDFGENRRHIAQFLRALDAQLGA